MPIWETHFPKYVVPLTHPGQYLVRLCQKHYEPNQRAIVNVDREILLTITAESINQMLQLQSDPQSVPLSIEALTQLYLGLDFPKKFMIFQNFFPSHVDIPKLNPPYSTAKFPEGSKHIISMISFILGYFTDGFTDESILGFLSTLSLGKPPEIIFYFSRFIADSIHHQLTKIPTEGVFR